MKTITTSLLSMCAVACVFSASTNAQTIIADSVAEFSGVQGQLNWQYGYYTGTQTPAGFVALPIFVAARNRWERSESAFDGDVPGYYTMVSPTAGHPHGVAGGFQEINSAVKRWTSPVAGSILLEGTFRKTSDFFNGDQDGVFGRVFVDGVQVHSVEIGATDTTAKNFVLPVCVQVGSIIDIAVDPKANEFSDGTEMALIVRRTAALIADGPLATTTCPTGPTAFGVDVVNGGLPNTTYRWEIEGLPNQWLPMGATPIALPCLPGSGGTTPGECSASGFDTPTVLVRVRPCSGGTINPTGITQYSIRCIINDACSQVVSNSVTLKLCPADFNCSGTVSVDDIFSFLEAWFGGEFRADINQAGGVTTQDIFDFLSAWFTGC